MEIHRPKAAHSAKEFLIEIGTIFCGIIIALGLEQVLERMHWRHEVADTREALTQELNENADTLDAMLAADSCRDRLLSDLDAVAQGKAEISAAGLRQRPSLSELQSAVWDVAKSGQIASHIPLKARLRYSRYYTSIANQIVVIDKERDAWLELARYTNKASLDPAERRRLAEDVEKARAIAHFRRSNQAEIARSAADLGVSARPQSAPAPVGACEPAARA